MRRREFIAAIAAFASGAWPAAGQQSGAAKIPWIAAAHNAANLNAVRRGCGISAMSKGKTC
jgi:hypothetical protein